MSTTPIDTSSIPRTHLNGQGQHQLVYLMEGEGVIELETKQMLEQRIEEATQFVNLDQLCLSPQFGFASTEEGNLLNEDEQWRKLRLVVATAKEVWGTA